MKKKKSLGKETDREGAVWMMRSGTPLRRLILSRGPKEVKEWPAWVCGAQGNIPGLGRNERQNP